MSAMVSVWTSYGHTFVSNGNNSGSDDCLTCGAEYYLRELPEDERHTHEYTTNSGEEPKRCTGRTDLVHGTERVCQNDNGRECEQARDSIDGLCRHISHSCNCIQCD
jgi:hypothetical protein